jgi:hypothetical protein
MIPRRQRGRYSCRILGMSRRWTDPRTARAAQIPARVDSYDELDVVPGGAGADVMDSVPGDVKSRYAVAGLVVAVISFGIGFSFGKHGRGHR